MGFFGLLLPIVAAACWVGALVLFVAIGRVKDVLSPRLRVLRWVSFSGIAATGVAGFLIFMMTDELRPILWWTVVTFISAVPVGGSLFFGYTLPSRKKRGWA